MAQVLTPELKLFFQNRTQLDLNNDLATAAYNGEFDILRYLLTSTELTIHADVLYNDSVAFQIACERDKQAIVEYLLTSEELTQHANIHGENDNAYKYSCQKANFPMVEYLLSFDGDQCIDFQSTEFDVHWALEMKYYSLVVPMMMNLYRNNTLEYVSLLQCVEQHNPELLHTLKNGCSRQNIIQNSEISLIL